MEKLQYPIGKFTKPDAISPDDVSNWIVDIEQFPQVLKKLSASLTNEQLLWIYRPDGWSIKQVIHHCADSHMNSFIRFKLALTEDTPTIKPYDEAKWATLIDGTEDSIVASLQIIEGVHYRWVLLLKSLNKEELKRQFMHPETKRMYSLEEATGLYAWHCNHHLAHIKQAIEYKGQF